MRVAVAGGRHFTLNEFVWRELKDIGPTSLILGDARGADAHAAAWARMNGVPYKIYAADWVTHGKAAGPIRNQAMIDAKPDMLVAFPGGRGTDDMCRRAAKAGIKTIRFYGPMA